jgi:archaeosine-15-forming tRNA-guanine transglycosylase
MPKATYEEGTEIALDSEVIAPVGGWTDQAVAGSEVFRQGPLVQLALRVTNVARAAWSAKKWKVGEYVTSGGKLYKTIKESAELTVAEEGPTVFEEVDADPTCICILPAEYQPAAAVKNGTETVEVKANGEVLALGSLAASAAHVFELSYRAAGTSP